MLSQAMSNSTHERTWSVDAGVSERVLPSTRKGSERDVMEMGIGCRLCCLAAYNTRFPGGVWEHVERYTVRLAIQPGGVFFRVVRSSAILCVVGR